MAKGPAYENLDREEKADILWDKITEDYTTQAFVPMEEFFKIDTDAVYDEFGDEFDCRLKTVHSQGNVGKAEWRDLGGHEYTGIFKGADTGFVRLSTSRSVLKPEDKDSDDQNVMNPTIALKFLRDQTLSANAVANHNVAG